MPLQDQSFSTQYEILIQTLKQEPDFLIIQDLDGVCMGLVGDPLTRRLDLSYLHAAKTLSGRFYVLTNGEHIGSRGVNSLVDIAFSQGADQSIKTPSSARQHYLPGLAGGGVQWQDERGTVSHPGISEAEMDFLKSVPERMEQFLLTHLQSPPYSIDPQQIRELCNVAILDNLVSPTLNINVFFHTFCEQPDLYRQLQQDLHHFMNRLLQQAQTRGLQDAFFVHYAPNLGRNEQGERLKPLAGADSGTTDFQFMVQGAVKETGVLVILNRYYFHRTGQYPLGETFNARMAPRSHGKLLAMAQNAFDPQFMPRILGVGDTVTSHPEGNDQGSQRFLRGGSDRGFLTLIQELGHRFQSDNAVLFVDSSGGELKRPSLRLGSDCNSSNSDDDGELDQPGIRDRNDPLHFNFVFPDGHQQYIRFFLRLADQVA